jgi:3-oxoadipate enol-lactonase
MTAERQTLRTLRLPDGAELAYLLRPAPASAPRLLLLHSLAQEHGFWSRVLERLAAEEAAVLVPDLRGHGRSGGGEGDFTVERFAEDVALLLDACGWPDAVVAGCSMGGCVALALHARAPQLCRALALIDTTAWYGETAPRDWAERAARAEAEGLAALAEFQVSRWFGEAFRTAHPEIVGDRLAAFLATRPENFARACRMLGAADLRGSLGRIAVPTTVIVGEEDYATPLAMSEALAAGIPGARLRILPSARHLTPVERPDEIAEELRLLLRRG